MTREDAEQIKRICEARKIDTLCHFTNVKNLADILRVGLVPRSEVYSGVHNISTFYAPDKERLDGHTNATCLSVSFPNWQMFYRYQKKYGGDRHCVILLSAEILWTKGCAFYRKNAADHEMRELAPKSLSNVAAFESMFYEEYEGSKRPTDLPAKYTTNPQAEVLVFGIIEPSYIRKIAFNDSEKLAEAKAANLKFDMEMDYPWFNYRKEDWHIWSRGS